MASSSSTSSLTAMRVVVARTPLDSVSGALASQAPPNGAAPPEDAAPARTHLFFRGPPAVFAFGCDAPLAEGRPVRDPSNGASGWQRRFNGSRYTRAGGGRCPTRHARGSGGRCPTHCRGGAQRGRCPTAVDVHGFSPERSTTSRLRPSTAGCCAWLRSPAASAVSNREASTSALAKPGASVSEYSRLHAFTYAHNLWIHPAQNS